MTPPVADGGVLSPFQTLRTISRDSQASRARIGAAISELYVERGEALSDHERALIHDILRQVIRDLEAGMRWRLSELLAVDPSVPRELAVTLANDEAEIAWPMLVSSTSLLDADLIDIIRARGTEHRMAIAARQRISVSVSAALVETGEENVILRLLKNQDAEISRETYDYLVAESRRVDSLQQPLLQREDMPKDLLLRMCEWIGELLQEQVRRRLGLPRETINGALRQALAAEAEADQATPAVRLACRLVETGAGSPRLLRNLLTGGHISLFAAILSQRTGVARHRIIEALADVGGEAQAILCRAIGFSQEEFLGLLDEVFRLCMRPQAMLERRRAHVAEIYPRLTETGARRALAVWAGGASIPVALRQAEVM